MDITVDTVNPPASPQDSIITASGLDGYGNRVTFGGDHRPMLALAEMVEEQGEVECYVESWQVLSVVKAEPEPEPTNPNQPAMFEVIATKEVTP